MSANPTSWLQLQSNGDEWLLSPVCHCCLLIDEPVRNAWERCGGAHRVKAPENGSAPHNGSPELEQISEPIVDVNHKPWQEREGESNHTGYDSCSPDGPFCERNNLTEERRKQGMGACVTEGEMESFFPFLYDSPSIVSYSPRVQLRSDEHISHRDSRVRLAWVKQAKRGKNTFWTYMVLIQTSGLKHLQVSIKHGLTSTPTVCYQVNHVLFHID